MRNKKTKSVICVMLVLASLLLVFAGCGKKGEEGKKGDDGDKLSANSDYVYVPEFVSFPSDVTDMGNVTAVGDKLFFTSSVPVRMSDGTRLTQEELEQIQSQWDDYYSSAESAKEAPADPDIEDYEYKTILCSINRDGTGYTELPDFVPTEAPSEEDGYSSVDRILGGDDGSLWVVERVSVNRFNLPSGFDPETQDKWEFYDGEDSDYYFRTISETGAELASLKASDIIDLSNMEYFYLQNVVADNEGNILFSDDSNNVYCITKAGELGFKLALEGDSWINGLVPLKDGRYAANYNGDEGSVIRVIDTAAKSWGDTFKAPTNAWNFFKGSGDYDFYYDSNGTLMGFNSSTGEDSFIINWVNSDMSSDSINFLDIQENGDIFVVSNGYDDDAGGSFLEVANMKKTPISEAPQKKSLTLAVAYLDYDLRRAVLKFNKSNTDVHIDIKDYSVYSTDEDYNAGITKLNTEIISGNVPDLICVSQLPYKQYAAKGLLEDLYSYIDSDSELSREDFMPSILSAMEIDGKLNYISPSFNVMTLIGNSDVVGPETGWTMKELKDIIDQNPQADCAMGQAMSREQVFQSLFIFGMDSYVNWATGECSFDSEDFKALLEFSKSFPTQDSFDYENMDWQDEATLISEGRQIVSTIYLSDFDSYNYNTYAYGDKVVNKGLPMPENSGAVARMSNGLAMTTTCSDKDAAWSFLRNFLTEEYQENIWELPTNKNMFEKKLTDAMKQEYYIDENGEKQPQSHGGVVMPDGTEIEFYAITEEQAAAIRAIIESVTCTGDYDDSLLNIIQDETAAFFNGEKNADETASIIQSRMSIYVNEQR